MTRIPPRSRLFVGIAALGAGLFCLAVALIPVAESRGVAIAPWLRLALRPACHQIGDRCLDLGSGPLAVCARCFGLYIGGFIGPLAVAACGLVVRPSWRILAISATPSVIDFVAGQLGLPSLTNWPRFAVATLPGLLLGLLLADAISTAAPGAKEPRGGPIT
jgi:uncharacterized membrane protein